MRATINIQEDAELRAAVKDMIRGMVLALTREEIYRMIMAEVEKKLKTEVIEKCAHDHLHKTLKASYGVPELMESVKKKVAELVDKDVEERIRLAAIKILGKNLLDIDKRIEAGIAKKMRKMIE
jgi:hypothetical protein